MRCVKGAGFKLHSFQNSISLLNTQHLVIGSDSLNYVIKAPLKLSLHSTFSHKYVLLFSQGVLLRDRAVTSRCHPAARHIWQEWAVYIKHSFNRKHFPACVCHDVLHIQKPSTVQNSMRSWKIYKKYASSCSEE